MPSVKRTPTITVGPIPPTSPLDGDFWWNSATGILALWYIDDNSSQWVTTVPALSINIAEYIAQAGGDLQGQFPNPTIKPGVKLTGSPTLDASPSYADNSLRIPTTEYVKAQLGPAPVGQTILVQYLSSVPRALPFPMATHPDRPFVVDGFDVGDEEVVHLVNQLNNKDNGPYSYDLENMKLTRIPPMIVGKTVVSPLYVSVEAGDEFTGATFTMVEASCLVGTDPNTWAEAETGVGELPAGTSVKGGWLTYARPRLGRIRTMWQTDLWPYRAFRGSTTGINQSIYLNLNRWKAVSRYRAPGNPWANRAGVLTAKEDGDEIVFDCMTYLEGQITGTLNNKTFHFEGTDWMGPNRIVMTTQNGDFLDVGNSHGFSMRGRCIVEQRYQRTITAVQAIKATAPFSNLYVEELWIGGFGYGILIDAAHENTRLGKLRMSTRPEHQPDPSAGLAAGRLLFIDETPADSLIGSGSTTVDELLDLPKYQDVPTVGSVTLLSNYNSPNITLSGVQIAAHNIVLSRENISKNAEFFITKTSADAFVGSIISSGGPTIGTLTTGQAARVGWDGVAGVWRLIRKFT